MTPGWFNDLLLHNHQLLVFGNVLLQQLGLPVPAVPTMMLNASRMSSLYGLASLLGAAVAASLLADLVWYQAGKIFGYRVLKFLCKMSINPGSCVNQTEIRFARWGMWSLVVGKFIPGFSTVAPPVAGAIGMSRARFLLASAIGAALWAGLALFAGYALQTQIDAGIALLSAHGIKIIAVFVLILAGWLVWKIWQKRRFETLASIPHISANELLQLKLLGQMPQVIDLRSHALIRETGAFPDALVTHASHVGELASQLDQGQAIVTFCACPADAGAIQAAHTLQKLGFTDVRPLEGGFEAWNQLAATHPGLLIPVVA
ncbi:VTT domain-containing protein [Undibacterium oligocarboniphilum]|uniref:VTT domain-containing protein n=1 Tax=Undibacterium oligocarboniphilum TaxID=666702 RepID=A0A850QDB9_9BURK|nr:VTT domain-containing protein [Undibacterium oligocarboniphilum]MBC3868887.1 VTT domain-containing protein [Undibacterium oligocarboniphilum]NVO76867.1 VTT domain-containing protein [Undibacterium oligocarboniphilum]